MTELLDADYTFVNERLARHYGIPNVYGSQFRRVKLDGELELRRGLLGKGSIETVTSLPDRTSPVQRGKWVLMNILGIVPPDPPPNVPPLKERNSGEVNGPIQMSMRQRMDEHRANPACASCHKMFDPIGFALESFDAAGRYRATEFGRPMDLSGQFVTAPSLAARRDCGSYCCATLLSLFEWLPKSCLRMRWGAASITTTCPRYARLCAGGA